MALAHGRLSIGGLSRRTGCNVETIRYYERIGLLPAPPRTAGGHRVYGEDHLKRLAFVRRSRELGFTLRQIREMLRLADGGADTCGEVQALTLAQLAEVRGKIADLRRLARDLEAMAAACEDGTVPACPVIETLFAGGRTGW